MKKESTHREEGEVGGGGGGGEQVREKWGPGYILAF